MKNSIKVSSKFDFRGETHTPELVLDLDEMIAREEPDYHLLLANANGIGLYSYEYEVLESSELDFSEATGEAVGFLRDGRFDFEGFRKHCEMQRELEELGNIARQHLGVEILEQESPLREALIAAYRLGQSSKSRDG